MLCRHVQFWIDQLHTSHNAPVPYPTMHHFVTEMCTHVHISVTKWCIVGYLPALAYLWDQNVINFAWKLLLPHHSLWDRLLDVSWGSDAEYPVPFWKLSFWVYNMYTILFLHLLTSLECFCPWTFFAKNELTLLRPTTIISNLHSKLMITTGVFHAKQVILFCYVGSRWWTNYVI